MTHCFLQQGVLTCKLFLPIEVYVSSRYDFEQDCRVLIKPPRSQQFGY